MLPRRKPLLEHAESQPRGSRGTRLIVKLDISSVSPQALHLLAAVTSQLLLLCHTDRVSTAKSGRDPDRAVLSRTRLALVSQYSSVGVLRRLKGCRQVRATHTLR
ncbi:unnamed protein product [Gadus morhua 'NCC']